jgi:hypothetical protein
LVKKGIVLQLSAAYKYNQNGQIEHIVYRLNGGHTQ